MEAVVREAREETGLEVQVVRPLDTFHFYRGTSQVETIGVTFHCRATGGKLTLSPEHSEGKWVRIEELPTLDCADWMQSCFAAFLAYRSYASRPTN